MAGATAASFPRSDATGTVWSAVASVAAYLKNYGLLPYQRTAELFEDLFSIPISVGTLVNINALCGQQLAAVTETIRNELMSQPVVGFDETGMSVGGELWCCMWRTPSS